MLMLFVGQKFQVQLKSLFDQDVLACLDPSLILWGGKYFSCNIIAKGLIIILCAESDPHKKNLDIGAIDCKESAQVSEVVDRAKMTCGAVDIAELLEALEVCWLVANKPIIIRIYFPTLPCHMKNWMIQCQGDIRDAMIVYGREISLEPVERCLTLKLVMISKLTPISIATNVPYTKVFCEEVKCKNTDISTKTLALISTEVKNRSSPENPYSLFQHI